MKEIFNTPLNEIVPRNILNDIATLRSVQERLCRLIDEKKSKGETKSAETADRALDFVNEAMCEIADLAGYEMKKVLLD